MRIKKFIGRKLGIGLIIFFLSLIGLAIAFAIYSFEFSNDELLPWLSIMGLTLSLIPLLLAVLVKIFMKKKNE